MQLLWFIFFFIKYLIKNLNKKKLTLKKYLFFSAIATICDQMPLREYNKKIVIDGFKIYIQINSII